MLILEMAISTRLLVNGSIGLSFISNVSKGQIQNVGFTANLSDGSIRL